MRFRKKIWLIFPGLMFFYGLSAQRILSEARLEYMLHATSEKADEKAAAAIEKSTWVVLLKANDMRVDFNNPLRKQSLIFNLTDKRITMLREAGEEKFQWNLNEDEWKKFHEKYRGAMWQEEGETREINGYLCKKATVQLRDGSNIPVFYTQQVQPLNRSFDPLFELVPGLPVSFIQMHDGMQIEFRLTGIQTIPLSPSVFEIPTVGYKILKAPVKEPLP